MTEKREASIIHLQGSRAKNIAQPVKIISIFYKFCVKARGNPTHARRGEFHEKAPQCSAYSYG